MYVCTISSEGGGKLYTCITTYIHINGCKFWSTMHIWASISISKSILYTIHDKHYAGKNYITIDILTLLRCSAHLTTSRPRICREGERLTILSTAAAITSGSLESTKTRNTTCRVSLRVSGWDSRQSRTKSGPVFGVAMTWALWHNWWVPAPVKLHDAGFMMYKLRCTLNRLTRFSSMRVRGTKSSGMLPAKT
jgi:hypothetical protein